MENFTKRLAELQGEASDKDFADACEIAPSTLQRYKKGSLPGIDIAKKIALAQGVTLDWLSGAETQLRVKTQVRLDGPDVPSSSADSSPLSSENPVLDELTSGDLTELLKVPYYDEVRPSAGQGAVAVSELPSGLMAFDRKWLRDIGVNPASARILFAEGDSMYPTIPNGSPMIVDTSKTEIHHGCIYVFDLDGDLMVKRIERLVDGTIDLISDNTGRYPVRNISRERLNLITVVGRVFSALQLF